VTYKVRARWRRQDLDDYLDDASSHWKHPAQLVNAPQVALFSMDAWLANFRAQRVTLINSKDESVSVYSTSIPICRSRKIILGAIPADNETQCRRRNFDGYARQGIMTPSGSPLLQRDMQSERFRNRGHLQSESEPGCSIPTRATIR